MGDLPRGRSSRDASAHRLPRLAAGLFRALTPHAERGELLADLAQEHAERARRSGPWQARIWLWRQLAGSLPYLLRRGWWRGWTGFEPRASRMEPGGPMFESWIIDFRYSLRRLASRPIYTLMAVLTLALGAGGTAAIFSIARELLMEPLPVARENEIGVLWFDGSWNEREFLTLRPDFPGFQRMAAYRPQDLTLEVPGQPLRLLHGIAASAELFDVLGTGAMLGRTFQTGDDLAGAPPVAVISHGLWRELGADPSLVGRHLQLGGVPRIVIGVMPPGFWFPQPTIRVWATAQLNLQNRSGMYTLVGRLGPGQRMEAMGGPLSAIARSLGEQFKYPPQWDKTKAPAITPLREFLVGDVRPSLIATLAAMAAILCIACVNVAALMLGQIGGRSTELAVRAALGAGRQRLIQQVIIEALVVGVLAGTLGALVAVGGFNVLVGSLPLGELAESATIDWALFWAACSAALIAAALVALVPSIAVSRADLQSTISTTRTGGISARGGRLEGTLVVVQIALAVLLATGAGLLIRSVANLRAIDPGLDVRDVAVIDTTMPTQPPPDERRRTVLDVLPALRALPGVTAVAATQKLPLRGSGDNWGISIEGKPDLERTTTAFRIVTHDYFRALGAQIRRGRDFLPTDRSRSERVVIINEALAAKYFPNEDPLGRIVHTGFGDQGERIVGVVENMAEAELTDAAPPARYMLFDQVPVLSHGAVFVIAAANPEDLARVLGDARATLQRESSRLAVERATTMQWVFDQAVGAPGRVSSLLILLAGLALALSAVGVYGVISHFVGRRTRDYGIHIALGLSPARVLRQVVSRGASLAALGSAIGIGASLLLTDSLASLLYGVSSSDPLAMTVAALVLVTVGALAAFVPAHRASRTDPAVVLRQQ